MDSDGRGRRAGSQAVGVQRGWWGGGRGARRRDGGGAKVLVEITSSTPAPRSIATVEVKAPWGEEEEEGAGGGG